MRLAENKNVRLDNARSFYLTTNHVLLDYLRSILNHLARTCFIHRQTYAATVYGTTKKTIHIGSELNQEMKTQWPHRRWPTFTIGISSVQIAFSEPWRMVALWDVA